MLPSVAKAEVTKIDDRTMRFMSDGYQSSAGTKTAYRLLQCIFFLTVVDEIISPIMQRAVK
jgi:hypothetical protein